jgi:hypothetical protein
MKCAQTSSHVILNPSSHVVTLSWELAHSGAYSADVATFAAQYVPVVQLQQKPHAILNSMKSEEEKLRHRETKSNRLIAAP